MKITSAKLKTLLAVGVDSATGKRGFMTVEKNLKALRESGRLRRVGPAKGGHWEVIE